MQWTKEITGINPQDYPEWTKFQIRDIGNGECVSSEERDTKNGKMKQYTLALKTVDGEERELRFLPKKVFNIFIEAWGNDEAYWIGHFINVRDKTIMKKNEKGIPTIYHNADIELTGCDCTEERVN
jgi:hypothetical protein